jgi:hypothetical protein
VAPRKRSPGLEQKYRLLLGYNSRDNANAALFLLLLLENVLTPTSSSRTSYEELQQSVTLVLVARLACSGRVRWHQECVVVDMIAFYCGT